MKTTDGSRAVSDSELDRDLTEAFAFSPPSDARAAADRRFGTALALRSAARGHGAHGSIGFLSRLVPSFGRMTRRGRAVALLAAVLIVGGAGRGVFGIYEGMVGSEGGARTAWDLATVVGASQTVDGYQVTVERVYVDPTLLMLAISVSDLENRGWTQVAASGVDVTDEQGRSFDQSMGMSSPDGSSVAANLAWFSLPAGLTSGHHMLHLSISSVRVRDKSTPPPDETPGAVTDSWNPWHEVAGLWTFTIPLEVGGGSVVHPGSAASVAGTEVRLTEVAVSAARVTGTIAVAGAAGGGWFPIGQFEHAGRTYPIVSGRLTVADAPITFQADGGTSSASGEWTLRINELVGDDGTQQVRLAGPWVLTFSIP